MKKQILAAAVFFLSFDALAVPELKESMKIVGEQFKVLGTAVQTQKFSSAELVAVETLQDAIADAALVYPETATDDAAKMKYSQWMAELMRMAITLEKQGELVLSQNPQNMEDVTQTLINMNELRKEAHGEFKPN